jgi:hypothetical protein
MKKQLFFLIGCLFSIQLLCGQPAGNILAAGTSSLVSPGDASPLNPSITGPDTVCAGSAGIIYTTEPGMSNYVWVISTGGTIIAGLGTNSATVNWNTAGAQTLSVTYNSLPVPTVKNITVLPSVTPGISVTPNLNPFCPGTVVTFLASTSNQGISPIFQWKVNCTNLGTNSPIFSYFPSDYDFVLCSMTSSLACASPVTVYSTPVSMHIAQLTAGVTITCSANPVCQGSQVTFTAIPVNGGSPPFYQWIVNATTVGVTGSTFSFTPSNGDVVTCVMTSTLPCIVAGNPAVSNPIVMTVNPVGNAGISIVASGNPVCTGSAVKFTATPVNPGTLPVYLWKVNGATAGSNSPVFIYTPVNGDQVACLLTSNAPCLTGSPTVQSNTIAMSTTPAGTVSVMITASSNPVCEGTPVTFTATPVNAGPSPVYTWKVNGNTVGSNSLTYQYIPSAGDIITCIVTSSGLCNTGSPATSNAIVMSLMPNFTVGLSLTASANPVNTGVPVTLTATPTNGGTSPLYAWKVNGVPVGSSGPTFTYMPMNGDTVCCTLHSSYSCASPSQVTSCIVMFVSPQLPVLILITTSANPVCPGTQVAFTACSINGGITPVFQWYRNCIPVGTNNSVYTCIPSNEDIVFCTMISNGCCVNGVHATSNLIYMSVSSGLPVSVAITASQNPVTTGSAVTFMATPVNGGTNPSFQWYVNSNPVGTNSPSYTYIPVNNDQVYVVTSSNLPCVSGNPATSNTISMGVIPQPIAGVSITVSQNPVCLGIPVVYTALPVNGGSNPAYQWYQNGIQVGVTTPTYTAIPSIGDSVSVEMTSNLPGVIGNPAISNVIGMILMIPPEPTGPINGPAEVCRGQTGVTYSVGISPSATTYLWSVPAGASIVSGNLTSSIVVNFGADASSGMITVQGSNNCDIGAGSYYYVTANPVPTAPVISANGIVLSSNAPSGNQWYFEGSSIPGATGQTWTAAEQGWYWDEVTLSGCTSDTSNHEYILMTGSIGSQEKGSYSVYPVPNNGIFTIAISGSMKNATAVTIYNIMGIKIFELQDIFPVRGRFEKTIDLHSIPEGIYCVIFTNGAEKTARRIIVTR